MNSRRNKQLIFNREKFLDILREMIRINSVNPSLVKEGKGEEEIAKYLGKILNNMGLEAEYQHLKPNRTNVIGVLKGSGNGRTIMLNGHTDTVNITNMEIEPLEPVFKDNKVFGRGSFDMKGGITSILMAVDAIIRSGIKLKGDVILTFVADEEYASIGTREVIKDFTADAAIITEPTDEQICIAHKGFAWTKVEVIGKAAHGSRPEDGIDAITKAGKVLMEIENLEKNKLPKKKHPLLGSPSIHASLINGGTELSTYPKYCKIELERRTIPGESREIVEDEMKEILDKISTQDPDFKADFDVFFYRPFLEVSENEPIVNTIKDSFANVFNEKPKITGFSGWMDSAFLHKVQIPTVVFGPKGKGPHASVEYVNFESVVNTAKVLADTIINFCS